VVSKTEICAHNVEDILMKSGREPPKKISNCEWYNLLNQSVLNFKGRSSGRRSVTEDKVNDFVRLLFAVKTNKQEKLFESKHPKFHSAHSYLTSLEV
jgi:hypothetical protein